MTTISEEISNIFLYIMFMIRDTQIIIGLLIHKSSLVIK